MTRVMEGVRVLELAEYVFAPAACGLLAEWGADVIKVEHPIRGDVYRTVRWADVPDPAIYPLFEAATGASAVSGWTYLPPMAMRC